MSNSLLAKTAPRRRKPLGRDVRLKVAHFTRRQTISQTNLFYRLMSKQDDIRLPGEAPERSEKPDSPPPEQHQPSFDSSRSRLASLASMPPNFERHL
jgi:hypothetical protein